MNIMGMGWQEMMIILVGALVIFGPQRLPEVAGQIGKAIRDFRKMTTELTGELERTAGVGDIKKAVQSELAGVQSTMNSATAGVNKELNKATGAVNKSVSGATSAAKKSGSTAAKPATAAKSSTTTSTTAKAATNGAAPKVSKKDPLADVSGMADNQPVAAEPSAVAAALAAPSSTADTLDALTRARQRRAAAGYNAKRPV